MENRNISSNDITIEQECSTDIVYLSTYLKAVIEGSTLDRFSANDKVYLKVLGIVKELNKFLNGVWNENSLKSTKTAGLCMSSEDEVGCEESPVKRVDQSVFSFSSPEIKGKEMAEKEASLSSEWQVEGDLMSVSLRSQEDSEKWNSISVISAHSPSVSQGSESSESVELLALKGSKELRRGDQKVGCWRKLFCCMCKTEKTAN